MTKWPKNGGNWQNGRCASGMSEQNPRGRVFWLDPPLAITELELLQNCKTALTSLILSFGGKGT